MAFDRLLARLFAAPCPPWALKGGYALEVRFEAARSTVDIDLTLERLEGPPATDPNHAIRETLQEMAAADLGDWFEYRIGPPIMDLTAAPYCGARYSIEARLDARIFSRFHLDAGIGDPLLRPLDMIETRDWLGFAGIPAAGVAAIPREQQYAEKVHAYTLPRQSANSRVKDLVDLTLLTQSGGLDRDRLRTALRLTFDRRKTHRLPSSLEPPPENWQGPFAALAAECGIDRDVAAAFRFVDGYFALLSLP